MLNTMNVWHNNCDDSDSSKYNAKFADLTGKEKEEWYDKIRDISRRTNVVLKFRTG